MTHQRIPRVTITVRLLCLIVRVVDRAIREQSRLPPTFPPVPIVPGRREDFGK